MPMRNFMTLAFFVPILLGLTMESLRKWDRALTASGKPAGAPAEGAPGTGGAAGAAAPTENALVPSFKAQAVEAADIQKLHNDVYSKVGEQVWENQIKPELAAWAFGRVVADTGVPTPTDEQILDWLRAHRDEIQSKLRSMAPR